LEHDILIPQPQADMLLREAAEREVSAEELLAEIITPATAVTSGLRMQPVHPKLPTRQA